LDEDSHFRCLVLSKNLLDCGDPPQATWSRRREEQDHARLVRRSVEVGAKLVERCRAQLCEWRLSLWRAMSAELIPRRRDQERCHNRDENELRTFVSGLRYDDFRTAASAFVTRARRSSADPPMHVSTQNRISLSISEAAA
jgi:hypothetical protein